MSLLCPLISRASQYFGYENPLLYCCFSNPRILNNLTGRSRHSPRHCPVSANAIASQLVRNGKYEAVDRKSPRLVSQEVSDLWRATTPDAVNISDNFSQR